MRKIFFLLPLFIACTSNETANKETKDSASTTNGKNLIQQLSETHPDGDYVEKYANGIIKTRGYYLKNKREGQWASFYPNGYIWSESVYKNGKLEGASTTFYENGKKRYTGQYKNDTPSGKWVYYNEDGSVAKEVNEDERQKSVTSQSGT